MDPLPTNPWEAARDYVARGLWVVAIQWTLPDGRCSCGETDCITPGKHLRSPLATLRSQTLAEWERRWPRANVGLLTGRRNGLVVIDVDPAEGGARSLRSLELRLGPLPEGPEVRTGGGGRHLYFRHPGETLLTRNDWRRGLDLRGERGYVVAPPSRHRSGRRYVWVRPLEDRRLPPPLPPPWLDLWTARRVG